MFIFLPEHDGLVKKYIERVQMQALRVGAAYPAEVKKKGRPFRPPQTEN
jgi:hypothetical protein